MFTFVLLFLLSLLGIYATFAVAVLYHLWKFDLDPKTAKMASVVFILVSSPLIAAILFVFFRTPWETIFS